MVNDNSKTNAAWRKAMKKAGWEQMKRNSGGGRGWVHSLTSSRFEDFNMVVHEGVQVILWRAYMAAEETPAP